MRKISAIIRTYNEAEYVGRLIDTLNSQRLLKGDSLEIVIVDSGSTDETLEIVKRYEVELVEIPQEEFNYSTALNLGVERSGGQYLVILSAHSIPTDKNWLGSMLENFEDEKVAGVYCKQQPWEDADWREIERINSVFSDESYVFSEGCQDMNLTFSNAASCIRRDLWKGHNFEIVPSSEDRQWAQWAIDNGYKIVYDSGALVYHSHKDSARELARRIIEIEKSKDLSDNIRRTKMFTLKQGLVWFFRDAGKIVRLKYGLSKKTGYIFEQLKASYHFVMDFNKK